MFHVADFTSKNLTKVYNEDELSEAVFNSIKYYRERCEELAQKNKELHEHALEIANDELKEKIKSLQKRLSISYGEFSSQKEKEAYEDFERRHMHDRINLKVQSGKCPYLVPTGVGVGTHLEVVCPICGESENITDISVW